MQVEEGPTSVDNTLQGAVVQRFRLCIFVRHHPPFPPGSICSKGRKRCYPLLRLVCASRFTREINCGSHLSGLNCQGTSLG